MPKTHHPKRFRDEALFEHWSSKDESEFESLGYSKDEMKDVQSQLQGYIVMPGDADYDKDRLISNPAFNPFPSMIIYCESESDVAIALKLASGRNLPFTVRSGGHCTAGFCAGPGVLIDVSNLDTLLIDPSSKRATVGTGVHFGLLNQELVKHGLHVPGGECEGVHIGGYVQGGGIGFTSATFGMNCDNVISMRVMLWDGSIVYCSALTNRDLWWAMRGGTGGNFGILLTVEYQLFPLHDVYGYSFAWRLDVQGGIDRAADALMALQKLVMNRAPGWHPDTFQALFVYQSIINPNEPELKHEVPVFMIRAMNMEDPKTINQFFSEFHKMPGAILQFLDKGKYTDVLNVLLDKPQEQPVVPAGAGPLNEDKSSRYVARDLSKSEYTAILDLFANHSPNNFTYAYFELYGGAIAAYPVNQSAFVHRDPHFNAVLDVFWLTPKERDPAEEFMFKWNTLIETMWNKHVYQNYPSVTVPNYPYAYWGSAVPGLVRAKRKFDPHKYFVFAQQVPDDVPPEMKDVPIPYEIEAALNQPIDYTNGVPASE